MCSTGFSPALTSACCASGHCWPLTVGTVTFGGPVETQIVTVPPFSSFEPALGSCLKTMPFLYLSLGPLLHRRDEVRRADLLLGVRLLLVHIVVDRHRRLRAGELLVDEEAGDDGRDDEAGRDEPRPQRPLAAFLGVLLLFLDHRGRNAGGCRRGRRRDHRRGRRRGAPPLPPPGGGAPASRCRTWSPRRSRHARRARGRPPSRPRSGTGRPGSWRAPARRPCRARAGCRAAAWRAASARSRGASSRSRPACRPRRASCRSAARRGRSPSE